MKPVKLKVALLVGDRNHVAGDVVMLPDVRAAYLIRMNHAEEAPVAVAVKNPDHNPFADCIEPEPPGGLVINPIDALSPNVQDHPGLAKAVEIAGARGKSAKLKPADVVEGEPAVKVEEATEPSTTANEVSPPKAETASIASPPSTASTKAGKAT